MARYTKDLIDEPVAVVSPAATRKAELDAIAAANAKANQEAIDALKGLGIGGSPEPDAVKAKNARDVMNAANNAATSDANARPDINNRNIQPTEDPGKGYKWQWISMAYANNKWGGEWRKVAVTTPVSNNINNANGNIITSNVNTSVVDNTAAIIANQNAIAAANAAAEAAKTAAAREAVGKILQDTFAKYGLGSLATKVMDLARQGYTEATITLELQNTPEYKARFIANEERLKKNLAVLSPAEYVANEDAYRQTLRAYGLTQFDNDTYVRQFIANDVSAAELSSRVSLAVQRVQNADPTITQTLRDFYGIGQSDMVAYILDPNQTLPKIQQQVAAAEIGSAARLQGLEAGVSVSEQLARQGISQAEAQKGYATIADILPTAEKLSQIYGSEAGYGQAEAEQEVFNSLASAQRKRRALVARETGTFSGAAGTTRTSLTSSNTGSF